MHVRELDKDSNHKMQSKMEAMFIPAHPMTPAEMDASTTVIYLVTTTSTTSPSALNLNTWAHISPLT
jgi:hypothetical protein